MRKILSLFILSLFLVGCHEHDEKQEERKDITILIYHPYVSDMTGVLASDYNDVIKSVKAHGCMKNLQLLHFTAPSSHSAYLIETTFDKKTLVEKNDTLCTYSFPETDYTKLPGLQQVMADVKNAKKAEKLGMVIGCHANGWIPVQKVKDSRAFGSGGDVTYKTNFTTLAEAITSNALNLEFLTIDDCNSQNIENAYDLRFAAKYILASATEIMMEGIPYIEGFHLLVEEKYNEFCDSFITFYKAYEQPYATFSVVDCSKIDAMVEVMKRINSLYTFDFDKASEIQPFGGNSYYNPQFYDFADYVEKLCPDEDILTEFYTRLHDLVPKYGNTDEFFWAQKPFYEHNHPIKTFCGITCSDPCFTLQSQLKETEWYKATHP